MKLLLFLAVGIFIGWALTVLNFVPSGPLYRDISTYAGSSMAFLKGASPFLEGAKSNQCWLKSKFGEWLVSEMIYAKYGQETRLSEDSRISGEVNKQLDEQIPECVGQPKF